MRTWGGSARALDALRRLRFESDTEARRLVVATIREAAAVRGNTPAVCRRCYVHPAIVERFLAGAPQALGPVRPRRGLREEEAALLAFLRSLDRGRRAAATLSRA